jgi:uncharacterized protein (DUF952 family)
MWSPTFMFRGSPEEEARRIMHFSEESQLITVLNDKYKDPDEYYLLFHVRKTKLPGQLHYHYSEHYQAYFPRLYHGWIGPEHILSISSLYFCMREQRWREMDQQMKLV